MIGKNFAGPWGAMVLVALQCLPVSAAATTQPKRLTNIINSYPSPSPDGTKIAFQSNRTGRYEIYLMNADGSEWRRLTEHPGDDSHPHWSKSGNRRIIDTAGFAWDLSGRLRNSEIMLADADGTGLRQLTVGPWSHAQPSWSSDGQSIFAYELLETAEYELGDVVVIPIPPAD